MADLNDPRAVRSRAALLAVAAELLEAPATEELSVTEVAARASVSRPTFYQHFPSVHALLAAAVTEELSREFDRSDAALIGSSAAEFLSGTSRMLVDFVYARRNAYADILRGPASYAVLSATVGYISERMRNNVLGARMTERTGRVDDDLITATAAGAVWLVTRWLVSDFTRTDDPVAFAERLAHLMLSQTGLAPSPGA